MDVLNTKIKNILAEKNLKVRPENIKKDVSVFGIVGTVEEGITPTGTINITTNGTHNVTNYASAEVTVQASGGSDVLFYDYDGTLVHSYSKAAFLALSEMPANPSHTGLVADGWNWTLSDAKAYVTSLGKLIIGQTYHTASGKNEFDIELNAETGLSVTLNMSGEKTWGDGTTDSNTTHTYTNYGKYTITCDGTSFSDSAFGQGSNAFNHYCVSVRLNGVITIANNAFSYCNNLRTISLSNDVRTLNSYTFYRAYSLQAIVIGVGVTETPQQFISCCYSLEVLSTPIGLTTYGTSTATNCYSLREVTLSSRLSSLGGSCFSGCSALSTVIFDSTASAPFGSSVFNECRSLKSITLPTSFSRFTQSSFSNCYSLEEIKFSTNITRFDTTVFENTYSLRVLDFSNYSTVPSNVNANAFLNMSKLLKIIVPDSLYSTWLSTSNWSRIANNIVKASEA